MIAAVGALAIFGSRGTGAPSSAVDPEGLAWAVPGTAQITAEVLNGSGRSRLARLGARMLREQGIDVVSTGNADSQATTRIVFRRGTRESADAVRRALGVGIVDSIPDPDLRIDVTVILGDDFRPITPLHP